jgi:hypothetical protein
MIATKRRTFLSGKDLGDEDLGGEDLGGENVMRSQALQRI